MDGIPTQSYLASNTQTALLTTTTMASTQTTTRQPTTASQKAENFAHNSQNRNGISLVLPRVFPNWNYRKINRCCPVRMGICGACGCHAAGRIQGRFDGFVHLTPTAGILGTHGPRGQKLSVVRTATLSSLMMSHGSGRFTSVRQWPDEHPCLSAPRSIDTDASGSCPAATFRDRLDLCPAGRRVAISNARHH